jgi:hypothetical protein
VDSLPPNGLLLLWERAAGLAPPYRALVLAAATDRAAHPADLAVLPIGRRDARLLRLRASVAGPMLEATASCPSCRELVEFSLDTLALLDDSSSSIEPHETQIDGTSITWRCPNTEDLSNLLTFTEPDAADAALFERCILDVSGPQPMTASDLQPEVRAAVTEAMSAADPLAEVLVDLTCPHCATSFTADVDVAEATWIEVRARAHRLLREVDVLARAYGWSERDVLELSERRRAAYLELATGAW